jgi:hypothetical protein
MGATTLKVVGGRERAVVELPTRRVSEEELLEAENKLREEARQIVKDIDDRYWDLGRVLYDVYDGVPGGYRALIQGDGSHTTRDGLFRKWGYASFGEYAEKEVGIRKRSAENLRYAYWWFSISLDLPERVLDQVKALGRSKVYLLSGFVTQETVTVWLDRAKELTFDELKLAVKQAKAVAAGKAADIAELDTEKKDDDPPVLPKPEELHHVSTSLYDGQFETFESAMKRAKGLSGSEKIGHNLELICQDFLANNDFGASAHKDMSSFLCKIERMLGVHLVAVDTATGRAVYGGELLWRLVEERKAADRPSDE